MRPGLIETYAGKTVKDRIFVAGGFAEVTRERCTVLAEEAVALDDLERGAIEAQLRTAREDLNLAKDAGQRGVAERVIVIAEAKLVILDRIPG